MNSCTRCHRHDKCNTNRMPGMGSGKAEILFVLNYPHIESDLAQKPFVDNYLKSFFDYIEKIGIKKDKCYFTYAVKCGTDNIDKDNIAIKACRPYIMYEICKIKPKYVVTLGNDSLKALTNKSGITKYRGQEIEHTFSFKDMSHKAIVYPTVSPSSVLVNPKYKKLFLTDMETLSRKFNKIVQPKHNIIYCMDKDKINYALKELLRAVKNSEPIGFDLETEGFEHHIPGKVIVSASFSVGNNSFAIPLGHDKSPFKKCWVKVLKLFKPILEKGKIITQNGKFDAKWLKEKCDINMRFFFDTLLASYILDENTPHNLEYLSKMYLGVENYKSMVNQKQIKEEPIMQVLKYNAMDTHYTVRLYPVLKEELTKYPRLAVIFKKLLMGAFEMYARSEIIGMQVDVDLLKERYDMCMDKIKSIQDEINEYISDEFKEKYLTKRYKTKPNKVSKFNLSSPKQKAALLYEAPPVGLGLPITMLTSTDNPSTSEEALIYLKDKTNNRIIDLILEFQKWEQYRKMFLSPWQEKMDANGRLHPNFKLFTVTGRTSCENPNVQQVPRDPFIRGILGSGKGKVLVEGDYSQAELRVIAFVANEKTMKRVYQTGGDIHKLTASNSMGKPIEEITKEERKTAKAINFGYAYGAWWTTFKRTAKIKYGLDLSDEECKHHRERYFELYSDLLEWHIKYKQMAHKLGYVVSPNGRRRRLPDIHSIDPKIVQSAEREAINSPIQGFASDITLSAAVDFYNKYIKDTPYGYEIEIIITVHDAIFFEVDEDKVHKWIPIIKKEMEDVTRLKEWYNVDFNLPLVADLEVGKHWGYMTELSDEHYKDLKNNIKVEELK